MIPSAKREEPEPASRRAGIGWRLNGVELWLDIAGALFVPAISLLAVADLHFEKGSRMAQQRGNLLPPYDTRATLATLAELLEAYKPRRVVCLGDSFHDGEAAERLHGEDSHKLASLTALRDWIWICGNHDPEPPARFGGRVMHELAAGPLLFRHEAKAGATRGEISGHFHPKFGANVRGRRVGGRCFVADMRRLILPAFGAYTGGLDVGDPAIAGLFPRGARALVLGRDRIHSVGLAAL
ncbi:MAG: ligase-associated DNA damage response endonuclease PdeM [Dongiaceae bacterium]